MDQSKEEMVRYVMSELMEQGKLDVIAEVFSADYIAHAGEKSYRGHAFLKRFTKQLRTSVPDLRSVKIEILVENEETLVWRRRLTGTHKVKMQGIPASNKKLTWEEMAVTRFEGGKIVEERVISGLMGEMLLKVPRS